jgi:hypothetical protein
MGSSWSVTGAWVAVIASGLYHGFNPAMGWPLAVSAGLMQKSPRALAAAMGTLTAGHLFAMLALVLPFAMLVSLVQWQRQIQITSAALVLIAGVVLLFKRRHPRALARIGPGRLGLWSFAVAIAHGAGLMLVPIFLGMCRAVETDRGHLAADHLIHSKLGMALAVASAHSLAMIAAGGACAWLIYRYLGLAFLSRGWVNTEAIWATSLVLVGAVSLFAFLR